MLLTSILKLKIAVPNKKLTTPEVGYYNTAEISNKIKINKGNFIQIKSSKPFHEDNKKQKKISSFLVNKLGFQNEKKTTKDDQIYVHEKSNVFIILVQLNPNLPEL